MSRADDLRTRMATVESAALVPLVPGEASSWLQTLGSALQAAEEPWLGFCVGWQDQTAALRRSDPALEARRAGLEAEQKRLADLRTRLLDRLDETRRDLERTQARSSREPRSKLQELRHELLRWILDLRLLLAEIDSLLIESVYRDRGVVD